MVGGMTAVTLTDPIDVLARTLWGEARGEDEAGRIAVANVVINRLALSEKGKNVWWGRDITGICLSPYQFSCWLANDPNRPRLLSVTKEDPVFRECLAIASLAEDRVLIDNTGGAVSYLNDVLVRALRGTLPKWADAMQETVRIRRHVFYKLKE
jgi:N-acetylmuramoyl-L-alanine amidase